MVYKWLVLQVKEKIDEHRRASRTCACVHRRFPPSNVASSLRAILIADYQYVCMCTCTLLPHPTLAAPQKTEACRFRRNTRFEIWTYILYILLYTYERNWKNMRFSLVKSLSTPWWQPLGSAQQIDEIPTNLIKCAASKQRYFGESQLAFFGHTLIWINRNRKSL